MLRRENASPLSIMAVSLIALALSSSLPGPALLIAKTTAGREAQPLFADSTSVTLEYFSGEGSFKDGYDFSELTMVRYYSATGPNPTGFDPDFYLEVFEYTYGENNQINGVILGPIVAAEGDFASMPDRGRLRTLDYGEVDLYSVTEVPDPSDPRFEVQGFLVGHTYGLFTKEGYYVVLHVDSQYPYMGVPYGDWYKDGITFTWRYASTGGASAGGGEGGGGEAGELSVEVYSYLDQYAQGDVACIYGYVYLDGLPLEDATVEIRVYSDTGDLLLENETWPDFNGEFEWCFTLPGFSGNVRVIAEAVHGELTSTSEVWITFVGEGSGGAGGPELELELYPPPEEISPGDYFGIGGCVYYGGSPVPLANVSATVSGPIQEEATTHTDEEVGCFLLEFNTTEWPPGSYSIQIQVDAGSYGSVTGEARFTVTGGAERLSIQVETREAYPQYSVADVTIVVRLTNGTPLPGVIVHYDVTSPSGEVVDWGAGETDEGGRLRVSVPSELRGEGLDEVGTYVMEVQASWGQVVERETATLVVTPASPPVSRLSPKFDYVNCTEEVEAGGVIEVSGRVLDELSGEPIAGAQVNVSMYESAGPEDFGSWTGWTDDSGEFHLRLPAPMRVTTVDLAITAGLPGSPEYATYWGRSRILTRFDLSIDMKGTSYQRGENVVAEVSLTPSTPSYCEDVGREPNVVIEIVGPIGGEERYYYVSPAYWRPFGRARVTCSFMAGVVWRVPDDAGPGEYELRVMAFDDYFSVLTEGSARFHVEEGLGRLSLSLRRIESDSPFQSDLLAGNLTDQNGVPVQGAKITLTFVEISGEPTDRFEFVGGSLSLKEMSCEHIPRPVLISLGITWENESLRWYPCDYLESVALDWFEDYVAELTSKGVRTLTASTSTNGTGQFSVGLENLDMLGAWNSSSKRAWLVLVRAEKEGYRGGEAVISLETPTVPDGYLEIVSWDPPTDFLAKAFNASGRDLSKLAGMSVTVTMTVRYNKLGEGDMVINVTAPGDWSNRVEGGKLRTLVSVPGSTGVPWRGSVRAPPGIGRNLSITVSGSLFYTEGTSYSADFGECGWSTYTIREKYGSGFGICLDSAGGGDALFFGVRPPSVGGVEIEVESEEKPRGRFQVRNFHLIQVVDVTDVAELASGKQAAVYAEITPRGFKGAEDKFPIKVPVELVVSSGGEIVYRARKTVSIGLDRPTPVSLTFTPIAEGRTSEIEITLMVDPSMKFSNQLSFYKMQAKVKKMKRIILEVVPLGGVRSSDAWAFILRQKAILERVYPIRPGSVEPRVITPLHSGEYTPWLALATELSLYIPSKSTDHEEIRVVGVVPAEWFEVGEEGFGYSTIPSVVFLKLDSKVDTLLAHEIGHTLGLYKSWIPEVISGTKEEYALYPDFGLEVHGFVLREGRVLQIPDDWDDDPQWWKLYFCWVPTGIRWDLSNSGSRDRALEELRRRVRCEVYDFMGLPYQGANQVGWVHGSTYKYLLKALEDPIEGRTLIVSGAVFVNGSARIFGAIPSTGVPYHSEQGDYVLRALSSSGEELLSVAFGERGVDTPFSLEVPYPPGVAELQLVGPDGAILASLKRSAHRPTLAAVEAEMESNTLAVNWNAWDADGDELEYALFYSCDGGPWMPVGFADGVTQYSIDASMLPGGEECAVMVRVTDGFNVEEAASDIFSVDDKPPTALILTNQSEVSEGGVVQLEGVGYDPEDGALNGGALTWFVDGEPVGNGSVVTVNLTEGKHSVTLRATDSAGHVSEAKLTPPRFSGTLEGILEKILSIVRWIIGELRQLLGIVLSELQRWLGMVLKR